MFIKDSFTCCSQTSLYSRLPLLSSFFKLDTWFGSIPMKKFLSILLNFGSIDLQFDNLLRTCSCFMVAYLEISFVFIMILLQASDLKDFLWFIKISWFFIQIFLLSGVLTVDILLCNMLQSLFLLKVLANWIFCSFRLQYLQELSQQEHANLIDSKLSWIQLPSFFDFIKLFKTINQSTNKGFKKKLNACLL